MGFAFLETMAGSLRLGRGAARPIAVTLRGRSGPLLGLLRRPAIALDGEVDAEGFADHRPLQGSLGLGRRLPYAFAFTGDDGRAYTFAGERAIGALTLLPGEIRDAAGELVGEALLRFDLRSDLARWVKSLRIEEE